MSGLAVGQVLVDRFELLRRLGGGGMGEVWLAHDRELDEELALKILDAAATAEPEQLELLRNECRRARALLHPNIVRVHELHSDGTLAFIAMQYISGGDLARLRGGSFRKILPVATMVCEALEYAHRQGTIHRDVKPANVLLDDRGVAYLTDFGIAGALSGNGLQLRGGGSLPFLSPQQLDGQGPAVADDVYGLGALLYDLLTGQPLFHPDATPERVRTETPQLPVTDGTGESLPDGLVRLIAAMLDKEPARRPAGMGAVRSILDELCTDFPPAAETGVDVIQPVTRRRRAGAPTAGVDLSQRPARKRARQGLPGSLVFGGLAILLVLVIGVVFVLPRMVSERPAPVPRGPEPPRTAAPPAPDPGQSEVQRQAADEVLGELLTLQDQLRALAVDRWGGADWAEAQRLAAAGDDRYRERKYVEAADEYRRATSLLKILVPRVPDVVAGALAAGEAALLDGDRPLAMEQFELALAVEPNNAQAELGLERAGRLDELLALMVDATTLENAGDLPGAAAAYEAALQVDPQWGPAREGQQRTRGAIARDQYETSMARGFAALSSGDSAAARQAFNAALKVRPGDADARRALAQVESEARLQRVVALENKARNLAAAEDWAGAARDFQAVLDIDDTVESSRQGLAQAQARAELAARLEAEVANADGLNDDRNWQRARALADSARATSPKGPVLARQIAALERALLVAQTPVPVRFRSDNLTDVVIYKVGRLGMFSDLTVDLRPGRYTAVGSRDGFRDARRNFLVAADGSTPTVVVRCEEPI